MDTTDEAAPSTAPASSGSVSAPAPAFDVRLIAEFDGSGDVVEWYERALLLCELRGASLVAVLPLRLTGGAFAVWSQLPTESRCSLTAVREALFAAFGLDQFAAYDAFTGRRLRPGESPDVFLADLRRLATLFGGVSDRALVCAFVSGLPDTVRHAVRAGSRAEALDLPGVLSRARAVLSDECVAAAAAAVVPRGNGPRAPRTGQPGPPRRRGPRCWTCGEVGHISTACPRRQPENDSGDRVPAPALSPAH